MTARSTSGTPSAWGLTLASDRAEFSYSAPGLARVPLKDAVSSRRETLCLSPRPCTTPRALVGGCASLRIRFLSVLRPPDSG